MRKIRLKQAKIFHQHAVLPQSIKDSREKIWMEEEVVIAIEITIFQVICLLKFFYQ